MTEAPPSERPSVPPVTLEERPAASGAPRPSDTATPRGGMAPGPSHGATELQRLGWWQGRTMRRARGWDVLWLGGLLIVALATLWAGHRAALHVEPRQAIQMSGLLDELQMPRRLPDVPLRDEAGRADRLWSRIQRGRAVLAFYAAWCKPCQQELPQVVERLGPHVDVLVVVSEDEDGQDTRAALDNLGLAELGYLVDHTGKLFDAARVSRLPTTYLISEHGHVRIRMVGYSPLMLYRMEEALGVSGSPRALQSPTDEEATPAAADSGAAAHRPDGGGS